MTKTTIFGLDHQLFSLSEVTNLVGMARVKGSLVLGLLIPINFLIEFLKVSRVRI
jgi:hypothetical protein